MATTVDKDSANWRLFGGGGLLVGGLLWLIATLVGLAAPGPIGSWLSLIGVLIIGVALFFVAFGETGSNGAVGASLFGKVVLVAFGLGWVLLGVVWLLAGVGVAVPGLLTTIALVLVAVGGILSAIAIYQRGVAKGAARWAIILPVVVGVLFVVAALGWISLTGWWLPALLAVLYALTGLAYLFNKTNIG